MASEHHREGGNQAFVKAMEACDCGEDALPHFRTAVSRYDTALSVALSSDVGAKCSSLKNRGIASFRLAQYLAPGRGSDVDMALALASESVEDTATRCAAWVGALQSLSDALALARTEEGKTSMPVAWCTSLSGKLDEVIDEAVNSFRTLARDEDKQAWVSRAIGAIPRSLEQHVWMVHESGLVVMNSALPWITGDAQGLRVRGIQMLCTVSSLVSDALQVVEGGGKVKLGVRIRPQTRMSQASGSPAAASGAAGAASSPQVPTSASAWEAEVDASAMSHSAEMKTSLRKLLGDVDSLLRTVQSNTSRSEGTRLLNSAIHWEEELEMGGVMLAVDHFRRAAQLAKGASAQAECLAYVELGKTYLKVIKDYSRASQFYAHAADVLDSQGEDAKQADWYMDVAALVKQGRKSAVSDDELKKSVEPELEAIRAKGEEGATAFIVWLIRTHPSSSPKFQPGDFTDGSGGTKLPRRILPKLSRFYHPDKVSSNQDLESRIWNVKCREIQRVISKLLDDLRSKKNARE